MHGADVDALTELSRAFARGADELDRIYFRTRAVIFSSPWRGAQAAAFRAEWDAQHGTRLRSASTRLRSAAQDLLRDATQQREASRATAAAGAGPRWGMPYRDPSVLAILGAASAAALESPLGSKLKEGLSVLLAVRDRRQLRLTELLVRGRTEQLWARLTSNPKLFAEASGRVGAATRWLKPTGPLLKRLPLLGVAISGTDLLINATQNGGRDARTWKAGGDVITAVAPLAGPVGLAFTLGWTGADLANTAVGQVTGKTLTDRWADAAVDDDLDEIARDTDPGLKPGMSREEIKLRAAQQEVEYDKAMVKLKKMQSFWGMSRSMIGLEP